jgi:hypothetical protein
MKKAKNVKSVESQFLGKKCYHHKLQGQDANGNNYVYSKEAYPNPSPPTPPPPPPPQPFIPFYKKQTNNLSKNQLRGTLINALKGGQMRFGGDNSGPNYLGRIEGQNGGGGAPIRNQF